MYVAIAEDDMVYRAGLVDLLSAAGVDVMYEAADGRELLGLLSRALPDVVLMDIRMAGRGDDGLETAETISQLYPDLGILLLSTYADPGYIRRFFAGGMAGRGYLLKESFTNVEDVHRALSLVQRQKTYSDPLVLDRLHLATPALADRLTPRECDVLRLLAAGQSNSAIADRLRITHAAVENVNQSIYRKLRIPNSADHTPRVLAVLQWLRENPLT
jgi:DNA-binding NarL/FixJ family response regulator